MHEHAHGHEHLHAPGGEQPAVYSFKKSICVPAGQTGRSLAADYAARLAELCRWADERDFLIGHIKLLLSCGEESCWLSSTDDAPACKPSPLWDSLPVEHYTLQFTAIVYLAGQAGLEEAVHSALALQP